MEMEATRKIERITGHFRRYVHSTQSEPDMTSTPIASTSGRPQIMRLLRPDRPDGIDLTSPPTKQPKASSSTQGVLLRPSKLGHANPTKTATRKQPAQGYSSDTTQRSTRQHPQPLLETDINDPILSDRKRNVKFTKDSKIDTVSSTLESPRKKRRQEDSD